MKSSITTVIVHYQTPDLLQTAVKSFRRFYPDNSLLIVDNGSDEKSRQTVEALEALSTAGTRMLMIPDNIFHGPAMDRAMHEIPEELVFFLDSDTETLGGGFLEEMAALFEATPKLYVAGALVTVNKRGFYRRDGMPIVQTPAMMIRRSMYLQLPPFEHRGMPTMKNFIAAHAHGFLFKDFPVKSFIRHDGRGTAERFGYGLGLRGKFEYVVEKISGMFL
jgi:glycosyltransferase involved in cell wall biosynthesis